MIQAIEQFLLFLGAYAGPVLLLLADLLAVVLLAVWSFYLYRSHKRIHQAFAQERLYTQIIEQEGQEVHLLVRRVDKYPVFAAGNLQELLQLTLEQLRSDIERLGQTADKIDRREILRQISQWDGAQPFVAQYQLSNSERWLELQITRCGEHDLYHFRDITAQKQQFATLEEKLLEAEHESKSKTTFLSRMSHEIRTPMNGIIGILTLAQNQLEPGSAIRPYLDKMENLSQFLLSLINDILDMSRIESGKVELEQVPFDLYGLAEKLRTMFQKNVEEKGVRFTLELLDLDVRYVVGDELRISQVLVNFLSNAQKFTSQGEIRLTFRQMARIDDRVGLMFQVHDTGIGMEPEFLSRIFHPFVQESNKIARKYGGSGLGMAIADQLVRLMGGEIVVDSLPGEGSDFTVFLTLPVAELPAGSDATEGQPSIDLENFSFEGFRILMAEDNAMNAEIGIELLGMMGATVEVVENGQLAVDAFQQHEAGYYNFILMDVQMPVMDGWQATQAIRALSRSDAKEIPIFALSADAFVEDKRHSVEIGMNGHFSKPVDFEELRRSVGRFYLERRAK